MLEIVRGNSLGALAQQCASVLHEPPADPLAREWIATPTPGIARWLSLELARVLGASAPGAGDGVSANVEFARVGHLRRAILDAAARADGTVDPWHPERVFWTLSELYPNAVGPLGLPALAAGTAPTARARRLLGLFTRYDTYRPTMLRAWADGDDVDAGGRPLAAPDRWQPRLYRALRERLGAPGPAERLPALQDRLRSGDLQIDLPDRLAFFGFLTPPGGSEFVSLLEATAVAREVRCYLLDPTPDGEPGECAGLVRSWGVGFAAAHEVFRPLDGRLVTQPVVYSAEPDALLGRLQRGLHSGSAPAAPMPIEPTPTIRIHGCQGTRRQVEVLRDAICARLAADPSLSDDDIVVCCGDLDRFVPLIHSVFGGPTAYASEATARGPAGTPVLRYRIDGAAGGPENPVVTAVRAALALATSRFSALDVVEFCRLEAVRRRWGFDDDALAAIHRWVADLDVRWGYDVDQRARHGLSAEIVAGTWQRALDRLSLGVVYARDDCIVGDDLVPCAVEGDDIATLGRLVDLLARLAELSRSAGEPMPISDRLRTLAIDLEALVAPDDGADWQLDALARMCQVDFDDAGSIRTWTDAAPTTLADLRPELLHRLDGGGRRSGAFRGGITFTAPERLAGVPFRVVCVLGLDDGAVPGAVRDGDDLMSLAPHAGDPDARASRLAALLAMIGAAGDALEIFHDVRDLTTNQPIPDSVPLAELWAELLALGVTPQDDGAKIRIEHPRHGTDPDCFIAGRLVPETSWSFDHLALAGARARRDAGRRPDVSAGELAHAPGDHRGGVVALADLAAFIEHPARHLCRDVLQVRLPSGGDDLEGHLRTELDGLETHGVLEELLDARLRNGADLDVNAVEQLLTAQGRLPVGIVGTSTFAALDDEAARLADLAADVRADGDDVAVDVQVGLADGRSLVGEVPARRSGNRFQVFSATASRLKLGHRLRSWVELLALAASHPTASFDAVLVRRTESSKAKTQQVSARVTLADVDPAAATVALDRLVAWYDAFRRAPEAVALDAFGSRLVAGGGDGWSEAPVDAKVTKAWNDACRFSSELRFLVAGRSLADILDVPARPDDPRCDPEVGRVAGFCADVDGHWVATVQHETGDER